MQKNYNYKFSGIYGIRSKIVPDRWYIGSAVSIKGRWATHISELKRNKHSNKKLQNHVNKYSIDDLDWVILASCSKNDLLKYEQLYIDLIHPYFNIVPIAGSRIGCKLSDESKMKISNSNKGKPSHNRGKKMSKEQKDVCKAWFFKDGDIPWNKGITHSDETKEKLRRASLGKKRSEESKRRQAESNRGSKRSDETKAKMSFAQSGEKNAMYGRKASEETREKQSLSHLGFKHTSESIVKMSKAQKGRVVAESTKKKLSEINKGKKLSEETKCKIAKVWKGRKHTEETKQKMRESYLKRKLKQDNNV